MIAVDTRGGAIVLLVFALILLGTGGEHRLFSAARYVLVLGTDVLCWRIF